MTTLQDGTVDDQNDQGHVETTYVEIDWQQIDLEELKKGYMRQSDYTKKTQELAQVKKQTQTDDYEEDDWEKNAREFLKKEQVITKSDLENYFRERSNEDQFAKLAEYEPSLKQHESVIKRIAQLDWLSVEEVIKQNNFLSSDKLERAKNARPIVWNAGIPDNKEKAILEMTSAEWAARKAKNKGRR